MASVLIRRGKNTEEVRRWKQRLEGCGHKPKKARDPQKLEEARRILPRALGGSARPLVTP